MLEAVINYYYTVLAAKVLASSLCVGTGVILLILHGFGAD
jgi:hypothetical protein